MKLFTVLAGGMVLAIVSQAAMAAGPPMIKIPIPNPNPNPNPNPTTPAPASAGPIVIKYVSVKPGSFMGKPAMILTGTPIGGGAPMHWAIWNGPTPGQPNPASRPAATSKPAPGSPPPANPAIMSVLENAQPGDCLKVVVFGPGARARVRQVEAYQLKPGEDEPNVYQYVDKSQEKVGDTFRKTVTVSRFGENISMVVPVVDGEPSAEVMQVIEGATANQTLLEIITAKVGGNLTIKTMKVYEPPKELVFVKATTRKDQTAIEVKDGDKSQTIAVNPKAANAAGLLKKIKDLKADQAVLVRSTSDDAGTWLLDIKAKQGKNTPTSKPATNPASKPG